MHILPGCAKSFDNLLHAGNLWAGRLSITTTTKAGPSISTRPRTLQEAAVTISPQLPRQRGSKGKSRAFECRKKLKVALEKCFEELFEIWNRDKPSIILTAGERKTPEVSGSRALGLIVTTTKGNDVFKELNLD